MHLLPQHTTSPELQLTWIVWMSACDQTLYYRPSITSPSAVSRHSLGNQLVMDKFAQMKTMLSSFLRLTQETPRTAFRNYLASAVDALADRDFITFRNEAVKLPSGIQSRAEERSLQASIHSNKHFLGGQVLPQHFNSHRNQHQLQGTIS